MDHRRETVAAGGLLSRAWYGASLPQFLDASPESIVGALATNSEFADDPTQKRAWLAEIALLKAHLNGLKGALFLEFNIPRMGRRIDAVLLVRSVVFVVEFKVGETACETSALEQVWDYALDLKNFHEASHLAAIVPILVPTGATASAEPDLRADADNVYRPVGVHSAALRSVVDLALAQVHADPLNYEQWAHAPYRPTPTIIEAARSLYANHSVQEITRSDAEAKNLAVTSRRIEELVADANYRQRKAVCFVTGVPGAGKTLVGLNVATRREEDESTHAVFLSGNGPLVAVLREALTRDEVDRRKKAGQKVRKGKMAESVKAFIQNVHHFRDEALINPGPVDEHVVIFDEAQRAWTQRKTATFMKQRKGLPDFRQSEPEFLISCMDRHPDWAVVVCLVGGGQEIHLGEAGIDAWLQAVNTHFPKWDMHISSRLSNSEYASTSLGALARRPNTFFDDDLHLAVSMRSFRAENVSAFVKALLDCERQEAREAYAKLSARYPIAITRNLDRAKDWLRTRARGSERFGLVASSKAQRLKPHAIDIRVDVDPVLWFLNGRDDTRSSFYLEDAATEFQVQGLELDWACVTWDADLRFNGAGWNYHDFRGDRWCNIQNPDNRNYLRNAYRVLLTRARQGMVIFIPPGSTNDSTRSPTFYDTTFNYLAALGVPALE